MYKNQILSASLMALISTMPSRAQEHRLEHWFEVNNKIVRPGESVTITWWFRFTPGPGEPFTYQGYPATVVYLNRYIADLLVTTTVDGQAFLGSVNDGFEEADWTYAEGNNIYYIEAKNKGIWTKPNVDNPLWAYVYGWKPKVYENAPASVTVNPKFNLLALEVPALNKFFPLLAMFEVSRHTIKPLEFEISDVPCLADCNDDLELNIDDFICFTTNFATNVFSAGTDCDQNNKLDINDFICFQTNFVLGC